MPVRKIKYYLCWTLLFCVCSLPATGQIITTIAGDGTTMHSGDGGSALSAQIGRAYSITSDKHGNLYFSADNTVIRKINKYGIISTIAGSYTAGTTVTVGSPATSGRLDALCMAFDPSGKTMYYTDGDGGSVYDIDTGSIIRLFAGNGTRGFSGDGGPATAAGFDLIYGIATDKYGNMYIASGSRVRMVNTGGIISTYAGNGSVHYSGDGGPATAAGGVGGGMVAVDSFGNVYISNGFNDIRVVYAASGIINNFAGTPGVSGFSGDGGPATAAEFGEYAAPTTDDTGNVYVSDGVYGHVRKVNTSGIIRTIAGTGVNGFSGDGGPAFLAQFNFLGGVAVDSADNIYINDVYNYRIRMINAHDYPPAFTRGRSQAASVCENAVFYSLDTLLPVIDADKYQLESWSVAAPPLHGVAVVTDTVLSTGGIIMPSGTGYTPAAGYTGSDSFAIRVTDGEYCDTTMIHVTVIVSPAPVTGSRVVCGGSVAALSDASPGGVWSSGNTGMATVSGGMVTGVSAGTTEIFYTFGNGCNAIDTLTVNALPVITGTDTLCAGTTSAPGATPTGGVWSSGNTSVATIGATTGIVTALAAGTATVTYSLLTGCFATVTVIVSPPVAAAITGRASVCAGAGTALGDATTGGVWSSGNATIAAIDSGTGEVAGLYEGTATISYSLPSGCPAMVTVTVDPLPGAITGTGSVCAGAAITPGDPAVGGAWSAGGGSVSVGSATGIVTGVSPGTATITYTLPTGCLTTDTITVDPLPTAITGTTYICVGSATALSDGTAGGAWSSSNPAVAYIGSATGVAGGVGGGTTTISYTISTGCAVTDTITVYPLPAVIAGAGSVCAGATITLSDAATGGVWSAGSGSVTVGSSSGIVTGIAAGTATITYQLLTGCSATAAVTVYPLPGAITGVTGLCTGTTTTLNSATGGGTWSSGSTAVATVGLTSGIVSGIAAGASAITYKIFSTGCMATATVNVSSSAGVITGTGSVCAGATATLGDPATGGVWSAGSGSITIGSVTGIVTGITAGTATITYSLGGGCIANTTVTVNALSPITGTTSICAGQTTTLSDAATGGVWSAVSGSVTVGSITGIVSGITAGTATVSYTLPTGCAAATVFTVHAAPAGITGVTSVCAGATTTLSDATAGGAWSTVSGSIAVGTATGTVTGITAGTATVTYSLGAGCIANTTVTVNRLPAAITGTGGVCTGTTITLSDATTGGAWATGSGSVTAGTATGIVTGITAGTATVSYTLTTGCAATTTVTVNAQPPAITGVTNVCMAATTTLSDAATGGTWSSSNTLTAAVSPATGTVTGLSAGTATITYRVTTGCATATTVTVNALPAAISGAGNVCAGAAIPLGDATAGGTWSSPGSGTIVLVDPATGTVTGITGGITGITYSLGSGCATGKIMIVNPVSPVMGRAAVCAGDTTTLTDAVSGGAWAAGSGSVTVGTATGIVTGVTAGTAMITYRTVPGCTATATVTVNPLPDGGTIGGAGSVCAGAAITLTDATTGGAWGAGSGSVSVGMATGIVTGITAGTDTIRYSVTNGCGTAVALHSMTVYAPPVTGHITGATQVCAGAITTLTDTLTGGLWSAVSGSGSVTVGSLTGTVSGITAGTATITYTLTTLCGTAAATYAMTINPLPATGTITGTTHVCVGAITTLTDAVSGGVWISSNGNATIAGGVVTGVAGGKDTIVYEATNGCGSAATVYTMTINPLPDAGAITGADSVCAGTATTLSDPAAGGVWTAGSGGVAAGSSTGIVTGITAGTAMVSYTVGNICGTGITTHRITVKPQPDAGTIGGAGSVCVGATDTLADNIPGGVWTTTKPAISTVSGGVVSGVAAGGDTVRYRVTNSCGTATATKAVTVNPLPDAGTVSGPAGVCTGATITLADNISGGIWQANNGNVAIGAGGQLQGLSAGTAIITYHVWNGCGVANAVMQITVAAPPVVSGISGAAGECAGAAMTWTDTAKGGMWYSAAQDIVSVGSATGIITGVTGGTDTVKYTVSNNCGTATAAKIVTIAPLPDAGTISGTDSVCAGDTVSMQDTAAGGVWGNTNNTIARLLPNGNTGNLAGITPGQDTATYSVTNTCGTAKVLFAVTVRESSECGGGTKADTDYSCTGNGELVVYPNPNPGTFTVNATSPVQEAVSIEIVNMLGQKLKIMTTETNIPIEIKLNEPAGVYVVTMISAHGKCSKKMTIE